MDDISEDSLDALVTVPRQVRGLAQLEVPHLDHAANRQTTTAFVTMVSDIVRQAGIDLISLQRQQQPRASRRRRSSSSPEYRPPMVINARDLQFACKDIALAVRILHHRHLQ